MRLHRRSRIRACSVAAGAAPSGTLPLLAPTLLTALLLVSFFGCSPGQPEGADEPTAQIVEVPDWIPSYPDTEPVLLYASESADASFGSISFSTRDERKQVLDFFRDRLEASGFTLEVTRFGGPDGRIGLITGSAADAKRGITVTIDAGENETGVVINYSQSS